MKQLNTQELQAVKGGSAIGDAFDALVDTVGDTIKEIGHMLHDLVHDC